MRQTTGTRKSPGEKIVKDIKRATRKHYSSEEKIGFVLTGVRGCSTIRCLLKRKRLVLEIYFEIQCKDELDSERKRQKRNSNKCHFRAS